jgi:hemoglobin/transferrin/lactoferrin receptor protein
MKKLFTLSFVLTFFFSQSQVVVVRDATSGKPLEFVAIASQNPDAFALTNHMGQAIMAAFKDSENIQFQLVSYEPCNIAYSTLFDSLENAEVLLNRNPFDLGGITISATKWKQEKTDIPLKIRTISADEIRLENPQTAADLISGSGEVYVQKSQLGGGSPMIRGFATNRVMLSVDGVRMNNAIFRSGNIQNVISIDPLAIENTEVIFGPGSVIYGSDAIGGVMSFYTLEPKLAQGEEPIASGSAFVRGSTANNERTGHLDFNIGLKKWAFVSSASLSDFQDLRMGSNGPKDYLRPEYVSQINGVDTIVKNPDSRIQVPTAFSQVHLMQKIRFKPSKYWNMEYGGHYSTTSDYSRYDRLIRYKGSQLRSAEWNYGPQEWMMHAVSAENTQKNKLYDKMSITAAYQTFKESRHDRDFKKPIRYNRTERVYAYSLNADFEQDIGERHEVFYGAEAIMNWVDSKATDKNIETGSIDLAQSRYPDGSNWMSASAYASDRFRLNDKVTLLGGLRYNIVQVKAQIDTTFFDFPSQSVDLFMDALTGSGGIAYKPSSKWQLNANFSTGFRAPNIDDVGKIFDSEPGSVVVPNANLVPEYAYNGELGMVKIVKQFLKVDGVLYYTYLNNALVRRDYQLAGKDSVMFEGEMSRVQAIQNAAKATVYGVQLGFELKLGRAISVSSRFNYQKGEEELDDGSVAPLRHAPPIFGVVRVMYKRKRLVSELYVDYNGEVSNRNLAPSEQEKDYIYALNANGKPYAPAWYTVNLKASYKLTNSFLATGGLENLLDVRYRPYSSGISAPGRNFILSLRYSF